jgi:hypothetical protein
LISFRTRENMVEIEKNPPTEELSSHLGRIKTSHRIAGRYQAHPQHRSSPLPPLVEVLKVT